MQQRILKIVENKKLSEGIYRMRLAGDVSAVTAPGQFINIKLKGFSFADRFQSATSERTS